MTGEWAVAALFAPVTIWLLWRVQAFAVDGILRTALLKLLRRQTGLYNVVSWLGTFIHEASHAAILLLSGHGIKDFTVRSDRGHVQPRRMQRGPLAFLGFLAAAIAPLYVPSGLVLLGFVLVQPDLLALPAAGAGLAAAMDAARAMLITFPRDLAVAVAGLDLAHWPHALLAVFVLIALPSSRPSHVKGSRFHGDEGDIAVVRRKIRRRPLPFVAFLVVVVAAYFPLAAWAPKAYWAVVAVIWAVALTGILFAVAGAVWWWLVARVGRTRAVAAWIPYAVLVAMQVGARAGDVEAGVMAINAVSFGTFAVLTVALSWLAPRRFL